MNSMKATKIKWDLKYLFTRCEGHDQVDIYSLWSPTESLADSVLLTVPFGRSDIAKVIKEMIGDELYIRQETRILSKRSRNHG